MPIEVVCPNGHQLKIKDKYAGKSGLCPHCQAPIDVPAPADDEELIDLVPRSIEDALNQPLPPERNGGGGHIDDDDDDMPVGAGASEAAGSAARSAGESLFSPAIIRNQKVCRRCHQPSPVWFTRCPQCDAFFRD